MDVTEQLATFRRQWKQEILSKKAAGPSISKAGNVQSADKQSANKIISNTTASGSTPINNLEERKQCSSVSEYDKSEKIYSTYRPFNIVGNLLNDQKCYSSKRKDDEGQEEKTLNLESENEKNKIKDKQKYKRLKLTRLKDIFVNRLQAEMPKERLLDKLISDIVSTEQKKK